MTNHLTNCSLEEFETSEDKLDVKVIDAREIAAQQRHPFLFQTFDNMSVGAAFILVNDHDPIPLYYQFMDRRKEQFRWEYVEEGPELWRVCITKINERA